jgi:prevent-host-death family protein
LEQRSTSSPLAAEPRGDYGHMTMSMRSKTIPAGEFKAKCLALLDEVAKRGETLVVTKRGKPVAKLVPFDDQASTRDLIGSVIAEGDLLSPVDEPWDAER